MMDGDPMNDPSYGTPGLPERPPTKKTSGAVVAVASVAAVALVATTAVVATAFVRSDDGDDTADPSSSGTSSQEPSDDASEAETDGSESTEPGDEGSTATPDTDAADLPSYFDDGQVVAGDARDNALFQVPSVDDGWVVEPDGNLRGLEGRMSTDPDDEYARVLVNGGALIGEDYCETDTAGYRALVGLGQVWINPSPTDEVVRTLGANWGFVASLREDGTRIERPNEGVPDVEPFELADGTQTHRSTIVVPQDPNDCGVTGVEIQVVALNSGEFTTTLVAVRPVGIEDEVPAETITQIQQSFQIDVPVES